MPVVAIVGAGEIGGAVAHALAVRARVTTIRLVDEQSTVAAGKALDLQQAGPIGGSDTRIQGSSDFGVVAGADAIVLADSAAGPEWTGDAGLALLRRLNQLSSFSGAVLICAGSTQVDVMQHAIDELGFSRSHVIGSAPEAIAATARSLVAIEARTSASQVALSVLGRPPRHLVIPWDDGSIGGHAVSTLLSQPQLNLVERRLKGLWPPGPSALGTAAALFCEAVTGGSRRLFSAFVSLDRENGTKAPVCAWPASIGPKGIERVTRPVLIGRNRIVIDEVMSNEAV